MGKSQIYAPFVGAVAVGSLIALFILTTAFAVNLIKFRQPIGGLAVASVFLCGLALSGMLLVAGRHFIYIKNGQGAKGKNWRHQKTPVAIAILLIIWSIITIATLIWMLCTSKSNLPPNTLGTSTRNVVYVAVVLWAVSIASQTFYIKDLAIYVRREFLAAQPTTVDEERQTPLEIGEPTRLPRVPSQLCEKPPMDLDSPQPSNSSRRRSGSDTMSSIRNSFTNAVKPMTSKSRLVGRRRAASLDSGTGEREIVEEGFDSWDTSSAETTTWQTVLGSTATIASSLNTHPHILETIPASPPSSSRSPSPGSPLDPPPPNTYARFSRSQSTSSFESISRSRASSSAGSENHIHPLFRSNSPTPPPSTTPTSIITAAPNAGQVLAGQVLADLSAVRRKRSGSLPARSPLIIATSFDSIPAGRGRERRPKTAESKGSERDSAAASPDGERTMTPPIPDWVMGAGQRASLYGYTKRKSGSTRLML